MKPGRPHSGETMSQKRTIQALCVFSATLSTFAIILSVLVIAFNLANWGQ
jgi:hypothetical protein